VEARTGFRLERFEVYNWGTFHDRVWGLDLRSDNALLTGDIGSGKSTFVDAVTTLLVPPQKITYNKAAGAEARERSARTYLFGHYKSERGESGTSARPVALRDHNSYSVILGRFYNELLRQYVTLAQVFWIKDIHGQPARLYVVAEASLSIAETFTGFGSDIGALRKRLRQISTAEVYDSFPPYGSAYRRRFGIDNEQALDLFNQTVSLKSVGNLTNFVREHMLEAFPVEERIAALIDHFENLNRAHEAVLKAKDQIDRLTPLVADCDALAELSAQVETLRGCREALRPWFAGLKAELLQKRLTNLETELARTADRIQSLVEERNNQRAERDEIKQAIAANGGDRIERIRQEISEKQAEKNRREDRAKQYDTLARAVGMPSATDAAAFLVNQHAVASEQEKVEALQAETQNAFTEAGVEFRQLKDQHDELAAELDSLLRRRSNIPRRILDLRSELCRATSLKEGLLPFAGELLQVRPEENEWEGAIERVLHTFSLSLLVPDAHYARVAEWVDRTHLGERMVYYRAREQKASPAAVLHPLSLAHKLDVKTDAAFYTWLEMEIARRFNYACCDTLDQFRREPKAITRAGQIKGTGERHEKDDRHRIDDRSRFVLGWSNEAKIAALKKQAGELQSSMQRIAERISKLQGEQAELKEHLASLHKLAVFQAFRDLDWRPLVAEIERLQQEQRELEQGSEILAALERQLVDLEKRLAETEGKLEESRQQETLAKHKQQDASEKLRECEDLLSATTEEVKAKYFPQLEAMRDEALGEHHLTLESCDNREKDMREWLQTRIDAEDKKISRLGEKIVKAMESYRTRYPLETQEADASIAAAQEYRAMLRVLASDDLPRFLARFKELLNENTIREVANFQSQLNRERETIRERIETINRSLHEIDYNPGRYIVLETNASADAEIRDFQQDLRACTEGSLTGSDDQEYSENKFLQVKRIIERFRGREGSVELDRRWTVKVTDVRHWFTFSASERWREDDSEFEHYTDSGGKSGGQKEKLAYTVLAASLAYQFGLEAGTARSRCFRFVVIDEAFGRGSDESARYGLELFKRLDLQLLIVTPLQKIHIIEPYVASVGFVHSEDGRLSMLRNLTIAEYQAERAARGA
jgi:uncharacterized protein YPO0396